MMYTYMPPVEVWNQWNKLIGKSMIDAYWCRWGDCGKQRPEWYKFAFKVLLRIEIGPHAYTLVFADGTYRELISYDTVCVYEVNMTKS